MMLKKTAIRLAMLVVLMLGWTVVAAAQDDFEQINFTPQYLEDGAAITDMLTENAQAKLYAFNAVEGDAVTVTMTQITEELDPFIVLLGPSGEVIASDDDSGTPFLASAITDVALPATGTYFIMATSFQFVDDILEFEGEAKELAFELTLNGISPVEEANVRFFAGQLTAGETLTGESTTEFPVFYFRFEGAAGSTVNLAMASDDFNTVLHVFSPSGVRVAVNNNADDGTVNSAIDGLILPEDGTYLVFATDVFFYNAVSTEDELLTYTGGMFEITFNTAQ